MLQSKIKLIFSFFIFVVLFCYHSQLIAQSLNTETIQMLNDEIENATSQESRAKFLVYRARNYLNAGKVENAFADYTEALKNSNKEWIILERCPLLIRMKKYEKAVDDSKRLLDIGYDPNGESSSCHTAASKKQKEKYDRENPPTIIMNTRVNPNRKTRFDVMREINARQQTMVSSRGPNIYSRCKEKWGSNHEMVEYCIKNQSVAKRKVNSHSGGIRSRCENKWGTNYEMVEYCINNQGTAKRNIDKMYKGNKRQYCEQKWGKNYEMVEYCIEN